MICSHRFRFIFIKTIKTASTSLEMGLGQFCGPDDIVTPIWGDGHDGAVSTILRPGTNYTKRLKEYGLRDVASLIYRRRLRTKFRNHESAAVARQKLGPEIWDSYLKFTVIRNPYDRAVSMYYWDTRGIRAEERPAFFDWLSTKPSVVTDNWRLCTEDDEILLDDFARYEALEEDLTRIGERIGLPGNLYEAVAARRMKGKRRPREASYREVVDDRSRELITRLCQKEIARFGYAF